MSIRDLLHPIRARRHRRQPVAPFVPRPFGWRDLTTWPPEMKP